MESRRHFMARAAGWRRKCGGGSDSAWMREGGGSGRCEGRRGLAGAPTQVRWTRVVWRAETGEGWGPACGRSGEAAGPSAMGLAE
jgi:hypothetical protein